MLKSQNRLKKRKEFGYIYRVGKKVNTDNMTLVFVPTKYKNIKIGLSVSNKVGKAVLRNKIKRQLRAILSEQLHKINKVNLIIVAKPTIIDLDYNGKKKEINQLLNKGKLLSE